MAYGALLRRNFIKKNVMVTCELQKFSAFRLFRTSNCYMDGNKIESGFIIGPKTASQFIRYASTNTTGSKSREWRTILDIGPTLRSAASTSRKYWVQKHYVWKHRVLSTFLSNLPHYKLSIKLVRANVSISLRLLVKVFRGESLSRRERQLFTLITADIFRLFPAAISILVPFIKFMLPVFLNLFPNMLPSTFQDKMKGQAGKRKLKARMEYAKFLEDTAREMEQVVQNSLSVGIEQTAEDFGEFASHFLAGELVSNKKIFSFVKLFNDEITLDNVSRPQLMNMCKCMGITPYGTDEYMRFMLRKRLNLIKKDDKLIQEKGVESLSEAELRKYCRERGIHAEEEMHQQLRDWLDLSVNHSVPSSILILSRALTVIRKKPVEVLLDTLSSLPYDLIHTVTAISLPYKDPYLYKTVRLEYLHLQEKHIKEEEKELSKMKQSDAHTTQDDVVLKKMTIPTADGPPGRVRAVDKQAQLCELRYAIAVLASALSVTKECEKFWRLVNEETHSYNNVQDKVGADGEKEAMKAHRGALEVYAVGQKTEKEIEDVDAKIGERWRVLERYCDGKVCVEEVAAAALCLKDILDKEGIQELIRNHSKYKEEIVTSIGAEDVSADDTLRDRHAHPVGC